MATFNSKEVVDKLIAGNGRIDPDDAPDNPWAVKIVEYNAYGRLAWGVVFEGDADLYRYERECAGKVIWERNSDLARALVRVTGLVDSQVFCVVLPGWDPNEEINVHWDSLPPKIASTIEVENRYFARACLWAESADELDIQGPWEGPLPEPSEKELLS